MQKNESIEIKVQKSECDIFVLVIVLYIPFIPFNEIEKGLSTDCPFPRIMYVVHSDTRD